MVLAVAAELMGSARVEQLLRGAGQAVGMVEPEPEAVRRALTGPRTVVVLDLTVPPAVRDAVFAAAARAGSPVIAFGPHVDGEALAAARRGGAVEVLTRGALAHGLVPLVAKHLERLGEARDGMPERPGT